MSIPRSFILLFLLLSGCGGPHGGSWPAWAWPPASATSQKTAGGGAGAYAHFDFDWQLSGDLEIMPVQVFDDGERMWLQFPSEGAWPAVFDVGANGWQPLRYRKEGAYMVLDGVYDRLALRGGHLRGAIQRPDHAEPVVSGTASIALVADASGSVRDADALTVATDAGAGVAASTAPVAESPALSSDTRGPEPSAGAPANQADAPDRPLAVPGTATLPMSSGTIPALSNEAVILGAPISQYAVSPADVTMRQALERWAVTAGWTFTPDHWAVDVDIPLVGEASFETDFKSAVRALLAATEMGDRPLQPCFYSNRVVRVVPYAQACDRRHGMGAMS